MLWFLLGGSEFWGLLMCVFFFFFDSSVCGDSNWSFGAGDFAWFDRGRPGFSNYLERFEYRNLYMTFGSI